VRDYLDSNRFRLPLFDSERYARDFGRLMKALAKEDVSSPPDFTPPTEN
jgi:predicted O-linked N-acetylglucosamine transferase (SPINDLY family)